MVRVTTWELRNKPSHSERRLVPNSGTNAGWDDDDYERTGTLNMHNKDVLIWIPFSLPVTQNSLK